MCVVSQVVSWLLGGAQGSPQGSGLHSYMAHGGPHLMVGQKELNSNLSEGKLAEISLSWPHVLL